MYRFKDFDRIYRKYQYTMLADEDPLDFFEVNCMHQWPYMQQYRTDYARNHIDYCVYGSDTADEWQKFRVSLKGWGTQVKLIRLKKRWDKRANLTLAESEIEEVRINNYIGALRRGGIINQDGMIVKYF